MMFRINKNIGCLLVLGWFLVAPAVAEPTEIKSFPDETMRESITLDEVSRGSLLLQTKEAGKYRNVPMQQTDVKIHVTGPIARTTLLQKFRNPGDQWLEAIYAFPLPENAAVDHMQLRVGERVIQGRIKEKVQAEKIYTQAKQLGKNTALVQQHRPNLFTTSVANIPPGSEVSVQLEYQQQLNWRDREFSLRFPMAITPRYKPAGRLDDRALPDKRIEIQQRVTGGWSILPGEVPNVVPLGLHGAKTGSNTGNSASTGIRIFLDAGFPVASLRSRYHPIKQEAGEDDIILITLADDKVSPDRDFVLQWKPEVKHQPKAAFFSEQSEGPGYGLLMLMPPEIEQQDIKVPRETLFVIDTSGSMGGASIRQARAALAMAIERLNPSDSFNVIEFNSSTKLLFRQPRQATLSNREYALSYVNGLDAGGGTEMLSALQTALQMQSLNDHSLRQVIFITDGAVGNERELLTFIKSQLGDRRLFTVGIGSAPNSFFMKEAAHFGRGTFSFIGSPNEVREKMQQLFERIEKPVLTNLVMTTDAKLELLPEKIPDLYAGEPLSLAIKTAAESGNTAVRMVLRGRLGNAEWKQELLLDKGKSQSGLSVHWGREKIRHWMRAAVSGTSAEQVKAEVLKLALHHHLVSEYTSLVAVDVTPSRPVSDKLDKHALDGVLPAGSTAGIQQTVMLASGSTNSMAYLLAGMLLLLTALFWNYFLRPLLCKSQSC